MIKKSLNIFVIGGGASGMVAAIEAARLGASVTILEKEKRVGKKLLATGNGRCNYTNITASPDNYHTTHDKFVHGVLHRLESQETISYFHNLGITHKVEDNGKVYPYSDQGSAVLDVLRYELKRLNVTILTKTKVLSINKHKNKFYLTTSDNKQYACQKVILATGGKASPQLGSDGSGYTLAKELGHNIVEPFPALVQLKLNESYLKGLKGVKWQGTAGIYDKEKCLREESGELLFTEYGISGPPILQLSRKAKEAIKNENAFIHINLFPQWTKEELQVEIYTKFSLQPDKPVEFSLVGLLHKRMIPVLLKKAGIDNMKQAVSQVKHYQIERLIHLCQNWEIPISGTLSWQHAQVTAGGIACQEVDSKTLESKKIPGLFITGEVLDVDGDCGGFNLQWAWSSGFVAGKNSVH